MNKIKLDESKIEKDIPTDKKMIMDIVTVASKNRMTIPSTVRDAMQLERGDAIVFLRYPNHIGMVKVKEEFLFENLEDTTTKA